jgi:hypothetical protein
MNKTLKWILGIVAILVLVSAMFAVGFMAKRHMAGGWDEVRSFDGQWSRPMMRNDGGNPMQRGEWNHPMLNTRRSAPFGGFFFFGGLVKFALFFGLLYGAYWLGRRNARITLDPKPSARVDASAAPTDSNQ